MNPVWLAFAAGVVIGVFIVMILCSLILSRRADNRAKFLSAAQSKTDPLSRWKVEELRR